MRFIQKILGYNNLKKPIHFFKTTGQTTERYTHVSKSAIDRIKSPLEELKLNDE